MAIDDHMSATSLLVVGLGGLLLWGWGCGEQTKKKKKKPKKYEFPIEVTVRQADDEPLPDVPVKLDGKVVGYTDAEGAFEGTFRARPGTNITLATGEMEGYRYVDGNNEKSTRLTTKKTLAGKGRSGVPVLLSPVVKSMETMYMVWVKTNCDEDTMDAEDCRDLPVLMDGDQVATTGREGMAHFMFSSQPTGEKTITIDTPKASDEEDDGEEIPTYEPEDPEFEISLQSDPTVYVFEKSFENPDAEPTWHPPPSNTTEDDDESDEGNDSSEETDETTSSTSDDEGSSGSGSDDGGKQDGVIEVFGD